MELRLVLSIKIKVLGRFYVMKRIVAALLVSALTVFYGLMPLTTYRDGTSRNISVSVVSEPFKEGPLLVYRWSGEIYKSCPVTIRRTIVDSANVVTTLTANTYGKTPKNGMGLQEYEIEVQIPRQIAEGPAIYHAVEIPQCSWMQVLWPIEVPYPPVHFTVTRGN